MVMSSTRDNGILRTDSYKASHSLQYPPGTTRLLGYFESRGGLYGETVFFGLEIRVPDGTWTPVDVRPGAVWVHIGELLEHASGGRYLATPHRVVNRSETRTRVSVPVFINPPLDAVVPVFTDLPQSAARPTRDLRAQDSGEHIHRVLEPRSAREAFHFGTTEWQRKGQGGWCYACHPGARGAVA
jgi:hypothetical protein